MLSQETNTQSELVDSLKILNGVKFTSREVVVFACVFHGRGSSKTSSLLTISPKTVESHVRNIMLKIGCNSREGIIDFIEKSGKGVLVREAYQNILVHKFPEKFSSLSIKEFLPDLEESLSKKDPSMQTSGWGNKKGGFITSVLLAISFLGGGFWLAQSNKSGGSIQLQSLQKMPSIRSELGIPLESVLLSRSLLLSQINDALKGTGKIQTVALVGIGGAGKTTLARQCAHSQNAVVVWEINAEQKGILIDSFEALGYALSRTEEERETLKGLKNLNNSQEREERLLLFVKERLRLRPNWVLLFDNVEKLADIQKYFPTDPKMWGREKSS